MPVNWFWGTPAHWFQVDVVHWLIKSSHSHICIPVLCQYTRKHNHATSKKNMITPTDWKLWEMWWQLLTMVIPHNITLLCILQVLEYLLWAAMMCMVHTLHYSVVCPAGIGVPAVGSHVHGDLRASDGSEVLAVASNAVHGCVPVLLRLQSWTPCRGMGWKECAFLVFVSFGNSLVCQTVLEISNTLYIFGHFLAKG